MRRTVSLNAPSADGLVVTEELWRADPGIGGAISAADFGTEMILEYGEE